MAMDEIQWRSPQLYAHLGGHLHSDNVHWYFLESPFFDGTSNNAVLASQAMYNESLRRIILSRETFEARLRSMSGLEYLVVEAPSPSAPPGTGVFVIRKQTRRKGVLEPVDDDEDGEGGDEVTVLAEYFIVGENVYMAATLGDILISRISHMASSISKGLPAADRAGKWSPSQGHSYRLPATTAPPAASRTKQTDSADGTPAPSGQFGTSQRSAAASSIVIPSASPEAALEATLGRLAEESWQIHLRYGGDYIDENPIAGRPGEFHLSTTSRAARAAVAAMASVPPPPPAAVPGGLGAGIGSLVAAAGLAIDTKAASLIEESAPKKEGSKTPKTPTSGGRLKRRKSKINSAGAA